LNQKAALKVLDNYSEFKKRISIIIEQKFWLKKELIKLSFVNKVYPSQANFLLVETTDANSVYRHLVSRKIITRNRNSLVNNCIRITVGLPDENQKLLEALNEFQKK
jgi:histidinol-phosphate aminotransferase